MGLSFLNPLMLIGLAGLAIPVIVHLVQSYRGEKVRFPSLMFLEKVSFRTIKKSRLRDVALFLLRAVALLLLVAAFARPLVGGPGSLALGAEGSRDVVLLVDTSFSMAYGDRWDRALGAARDVLDRLGRDDRAALVRFDDGAEVLASFTADRGRLRGSLDTVEPGERTTRFAAAIDLARQLLLGSEQPRREVVLISDMQRSGWQTAEPARLPAWADFEPVDVSEPDHSNLSVASVRLRQRHSGEGTLLTVTARLLNRGPLPVESREVRLEIDGRERGSRVVSVDEGGFANVEFDEVTLPSGEVRGTVAAESDRLPGDDVFRFLIGAGRSLRVLLVEGTRQRERAGLYVASALSIGDRPTYDVTVVGAAADGPASLDDFDVVILDGASGWAAENAARLRDWVSAGGGLIAALGSVDESGRSALPGLLPATGPQPAELGAERGGALGEVDLEHPVFALFSTPRGGDLSAARFYRYQRLAGGWDGDVVARYEDGAPALLEHREGEGVVLVWTSTLDTYWNDLPLQPVFLPLVHQMTRYASGYREYPEWFTVGDVYQLPVGALGEGEGAVVTDPSGGQDGIEAVGGEAVVSLDESGFYAFSGLDQGWTGPRGVAVNRDPVESDLTPMDVEEFTLAASEPGGAATVMPEEQGGIEESERRQALWWYMLLTVGLLLAAETLAANRARRSGAPGAEGGTS
jgi:hypothetical protein